MRNIFLEKSYTKCGGKASSKPFNKMSKLSISLDQKSEISQSFFFIVCPSRGLPKYTKPKLLTTSFSLIQSFLQKKKRTWN